MFFEKAVDTKNSQHQSNRNTPSKLNTLPIEVIALILSFSIEDITPPMLEQRRVSWKFNFCVEELTKKRWEFYSKNTLPLVSLQKALDDKVEVASPYLEYRRKLHRDMLHASHLTMFGSTLFLLFCASFNKPQISFSAILTLTLAYAKLPDSAELLCSISPRFSILFPDETNHYLRAIDKNEVIKSFSCRLSQD